VRRFFKVIGIFFSYLGNLFIWNKMGWYIGDSPPVDSQGFRIITKQKPYHERTCRICRRPFWSYKKSDICYDPRCYIKFNLGKGD
jgi:hypothetical protein